MIEITRYILAAIVAETHIWPLKTSWAGQISVFAFYTLSGYLMTRVLNDRYGFTIRGTAAFAFNRVLRLWPAYLVLMGLVLVALYFLPLYSYEPFIRVPRTAADIIENITIIGQVSFGGWPSELPARPLVTSWSLAIEVFCYLLLAVYFAKSSARLWALMAFGFVGMALATGWCAASVDPAIYGPYCFQSRYGVVQAGFVPFACGGLYYFHEKSVTVWLKRHFKLVLFLFAAAIPALASLAFRSTVAPFIGIPVMLALLARTARTRPTRTQDFFGRSSYHLFIGHMPTAAVLVTGFGIPGNSSVLFAATLVVTLALSALLVPMEWGIDHLRGQIRDIARRAKESSLRQRPLLASEVTAPDVNVVPSETG